MTEYVARPAHGAAWVTGASAGIGRAVAERLAAEGFTVYATARSADRLADLAGATSALSGHVVAMPGDVTDADDMARIVDTIERQHGALALAIFGAGTYIPVHGEALEVGDFERTFAVNLAGVVNGMVPAVEAMKRAGRGQIVFVASATGHGGLPTGAAYGASKAALINMAESLKFDFDKLGIRIQLVNPGVLETPATRQDEFPMPDRLPVGEAARRIAEGLKSGSFEITFPGRFVTLPRLLRLLPYGAYFAVLNRRTGWKKRPLKADADETGVLEKAG